MDDKAKEQFPSGIVLRLCKYVSSPSVWTEDNAGEPAHFAFGNFDYVSFRPVEKFADYYSESSRGTWRGYRQDVMLYALSDESERCFGFDNEDSVSCFRIFQNGAPIQKKFMVISMLYVSGTVKNYFCDYSRFLDCCKRAVLDIVRACNDAGGDQNSIICEVFGTFNSSELAILWGTDQFTDVQYIVDHIRYLSFKFKTSGGWVPGSAFISTYSIIASGGQKFNTDGLKGKALVQLVSRVDREAHVNWGSSLKFLGSWNGENRDILCCAGEYDFIYSGGLPILEQIHSAYGSCAADSEAFRKEFWCHFSRGATRIVYREEDVSPYLRGLSWDSLLQMEVDISNCAIPPESGPEEAARREKCQQDIDRFLRKIKQSSTAAGRASNFYYELLLLESDYIQCVSTSLDDRWARDFQEQYATAIQILDCLFTDTFNGAICSQYLELAQSVISVLQHQIRHISDAGKLFFEEPYSHLESTGRYDLLFHMYYGAVKEILTEFYQLRDPLDTPEQQQSELVPIVRFQPVQIINSNLFFSISTERRLVDISIPYDAWCEPCFYIPFLVHELYHYAVPVDRRVRNRLFTVLIATEMTVTAFSFWLEDLSRELSGKLEQTTPEEVMEIVKLSLRESIASYLFQVAEKSSVVGDYCLQWQEFEQEMTQWAFAFPEDGASCLFSQLQAAPWEDMLSRCAADFDTDERGPDIRQFCDVLLQAIRNPKDPSDPPMLYDYFLERSTNNWRPMILQLRELFPDLAMICITGADAWDYLILFAFGQEKLGNGPQDLAQSELYLKIRIGFVLDRCFDSFAQNAELCAARMREGRKKFLTKYLSYVSNSNWRNEESAVNGAEAGANGWFDFFEYLYTDYLNTCVPYRPILAELGESQFAPLCPNEGPTRDLCCAYFSALSHGGGSGDNAEFQQCIKAIHVFQKQPLLEQVLTRPRPVITTGAATRVAVRERSAALKEVECRMEPLVVGRVSELTWPIYTASSNLRKSHRNVFGVDTGKLWYRGSQNADYDILPSIMVHFFDHPSAETGRNAVGTLWEYQRSILERFKYRADGAAEFINPSAYSACDYIALMQHYGQHTTYVDWSEDAYTSLYFALEDYILDSKVKEYKDKNAALYVMDPMLYNRARRMLFQKVDSENREVFCPNDTWYHKQSRAIQEMQEGHIPNLSISYNKRRYGLFSFDVPTEEDVNIARKSKFLTCKTSPEEARLGDFSLETWNLPLAVYTSRLNPRLRAQSGMFLAFSPFSLPVCQDGFSSGPSAFSYLALLNIQEHFLKTFPDEDPFIYEIRILNYAKDKIGEQLKLAGINKYRIYPELENLDLGL